MKLFLLLFSLLFSLNTWAMPTAADEWERMESMVRTGVITQEGASREILTQKHKGKAARNEAQRGLASVHPDLKPMRLKQLKIEPMEIFID